jgi:hypothetical protein
LQRLLERLLLGGVRGDPLFQSLGTQSLGQLFGIGGASPLRMSR